MKVGLRHVGWIPHLAIAKLLAGADVCCSVFYSRRYEKVLSGKAGPIKLYEYMACGKPIIATHHTAMRHVIEKAHCGVLVDPVQGAEAIAEALEFYYSNPERLREHGTNGRRAVEQWFNWSIAEKRLYHIYAELLTRMSQREGAKNRGD